MTWDPKNDGLPQIENMLHYLQSLDWTEPWLYILIAFYLALSIFLYLTRKYSVIQGFSFLFLLLTVYIAEDLNEYFAKNHKLFTKHQYFDSSGLFISLMMSMPLLFISAFIVGNWIHQSTLLMQQVKKMQMEKAIMNAGKKTQ